MERLQQFIDAFEWESEAQRKGFLSLIQFMRKHGAVMEARTLHIIACYFIQKDHESHEWWIGVIGDQIKSLEDRLMDVSHRLAVLENLLVHGG